MILFYLWRDGVLGRTDREKFGFFFGATGNPLYLSKKWPLVTALNWPKALLWPPYARAAATWLAYRVALFDGESG